MRPAKRPAIQDGPLDDVIEQIENALPAIHRMCRVQLKQKKAPTDRLPPEQIQQARTRLQELSENPVVIDEHAPILRINGGSNHVNGSD